MAKSRPEEIAGTERCNASAAIMVREGMAWAFVRYSRDYVDDGAKAKAEQLGVHAHGCLPVWECRTEALMASYCDC